MQREGFQVLLIKIKVQKGQFFCKIRTNGGKLDPILFLILGTRIQKITHYGRIADAVDIKA
jgi:hypothetical protein